MGAETRALLQQALRLGAVERAELIEALLGSFETPEGEAAAAAWAAEAERRVDAYEQGESGASSAGDVFSRLSGG